MVRFYCSVFHFPALPEASHGSSNRVIDSHNLDQLCDEKNSFHFVIESREAHVSSAVAHGSERSNENAEAHAVNDFEPGQIHNDFSCTLFQMTIDAASNLRCIRFTDEVPFQRQHKDISIHFLCDLHRKTRQIASESYQRIISSHTKITVLFLVDWIKSSGFAHFFIDSSADRIPSQSLQMSPRGGPSDNEQMIRRINFFYSKLLPTST